MCGRQSNPINEAKAKDGLKAVAKDKDREIGQGGLGLVMLEVHTKGKGVCGVFTFEIAETKVAQVMTYSRQHQHPLLCTMEET